MSFNGVISGIKGPAKAKKQEKRVPLMPCYLRGRAVAEMNKWIHMKMALKKKTCHSKAIDDCNGTKGVKENLHHGDRGQNVQ